MKSFRNPKYLERYEDVVFDLEQAINVAPANNDYQERNNHKFISDNRSEVTPFDWYNARIALDFKVQQRDGTNFAIPANAVAVKFWQQQEVIITHTQITKWEL